MATSFWCDLCDRHHYRFQDCTAWQKQKIFSSPSLEKTSTGSSSAAAAPADRNETKPHRSFDVSIELQPPWDLQASIENRAKIVRWLSNDVSAALNSLLGIAEKSADGPLTLELSMRLSNKR
jgi:hypothetical protein